jgi:hypothetical protein
MHVSQVDVMRNFFLELYVFFAELNTAFGESLRGIHEGSAESWVATAVLGPT